MSKDYADVPIDTKTSRLCCCVFQRQGQRFANGELGGSRSQEPVQFISKFIQDYTIFKGY